MNQELSVIHARLAEFDAAQKAAFTKGGEAVAAASRLGEALAVYKSQDLPLIVEQVQGLTIESARNFIRVHAKIKECGSAMDAADYRQLLMWTELVPSPEPRNPEPGQPSKVIEWAVKLESKIPRLTQDERGKLRIVLQSLLAKLDR